MNLRNLTLLGAVACALLFVVLMVLTPGNEIRGLTGTAGALALVLFALSLFTTLSRGHRHNTHRRR